MEPAHDYELVRNFAFRKLLTDLSELNRILKGKRHGSIDFLPQKKYDNLKRKFRPLCPHSAVYGGKVPCPTDFSYAN